MVFIYSNEVGSDQSVSYLNFFRFISERQNSSEIQKDTDVYKIKICKLAIKPQSINASI